MPRKLNSKSKIFLLFVLLLFALGLTGCADIVQEIWIGPDGGGECSLLVAISQLGVQFRSHDQLAESIHLASQNPSNDIEIVAASDWIVADTHYYVYHIKTTDIHNCFVQQPGQLTTIEQIPIQNNRTLFRQSFHNQKDLASATLEGFLMGTGDYKEIDQIAKTLQSSVFKNHYWTVMLHVPGEVAYTNGNYEETTQTTVWQVEMIDIVQPDAKPVTLELEYLAPGDQLRWYEQLGLRNIPGWLLISMAILGFLSFGAFIFGITAYARLKK